VPSSTKETFDAAQVTQFEQMEAEYGIANIGNATHTGSVIPHAISFRPSEPLQASFSNTGASQRPWKRSGSTLVGPKGKGPCHKPNC